MAYFFTLEQLGRGTFEVESLLSYWCRLSEIHGLTVSQLSTQMAAWGKRQGLGFPLSLLYGRVLSMCSYGDHVQKMVRIVEAATGSVGLHAGTLLGLKPVLAPSGIGALKSHKAWCPRCYEDDRKSRGICYDRLLWAMNAIERCPIHKLKLLLHCPHCGSLQKYPHPSGLVSTCRSCQESLVGSSKDWQVMLQPGFAESDLSNLLAHLASHDARPLKRDAFRTYEFYASQIRRSKLLAAEGEITSRKARFSPPRLQTLLKVAMRDGTDLVHMLIDPKEAARQSQQLTNFSISLKVVNRMRTPELVIERTRQMLEEAAEGDGSSSFAAHCRQIGVTKGFAQYRFPELCNKVVRLWLARLMRERSQRIRSAARLLVDTEWQLYVDGTHTSQDKLAAEISGKSGCTIRAARLIVEARIRGSRRKELLKTECVMAPTRHDECLMTNEDYAATFGKNLNYTNTLISRMKRQGEIFDIPVRGERLPRFQFDIRGKPLPVMRRLLDHIRPGVEVVFLDWLLMPHKLLAGKRPVDVLDQGADGMLLSLVEAEFADEHTRSGQSA